MTDLSPHSESLFNIKKYLNETFLNPLKCDISGMHCDTFYYYVICSIFIMSAFILFYANKYSGFGLLLTVGFLCVIMMSCGIIILNMCKNKSPREYSYITLFCSLLLLIIIINITK